jgi:branched-chain amino acid transport system permease protein
MSHESEARRHSPSLARTIPRSILPVAIGIALSVIAQLFIPGGGFYYTLMVAIGINVILSASLNIVNGFTGQFSIGHAGFMLVGGYVAGIITYYGSFHMFGSTRIIDEFLGRGEWLFVAGCVAGGVVAAGCGYLVGLPSLRLRGDYLAIVTLGFGEIVRVLFQLTRPVLKGDDLAHASLGDQLSALGGAQGFGAIPRYTTLFWVYVFVTLCLVVSIRLKRSSFGRAFLAIRENEIAAEAMGVNTTQSKVRAFVLSAFFAGIAGALFAHQLATNLNPRELGFQKSFDVVIMVVLGGMGSVSGAVVAAVLLTILPELLRSVSEYRMIAYALLLIVMMIVRPQGIFGVREIWDLWRKKR